MKKIKLTVLFLIPLALTAQQAVPATGGDISGSGGTVAYSVGQIFYTVNTGSNQSIVQGVQQPFEISEVLGIEEQDKLQIDLDAYPNPTNENLTLRVQGDASSMLRYELYDIQGKLLLSKEMTSTSAKISMEHLPKATYILKVNKNESAVKTFKIIKN